jgi:hypothetical protein
MAECQWLKPVLVAQIEFLERTADDHLRHSRFVGLREDKKAKDVHREWDEVAMPFKSQAQRRKFAQLLVEGKISGETFEEWNREGARRSCPSALQTEDRYPYQKPVRVASFEDTGILR